MLKLGGFGKKPVEPEEDPVNLVASAPEEEPVEEEVESMPEPLGDVVLPKALVVYMGGEFGPFQCSNCCYFRGDNTCQMVDGDIDPDGCCNLFCPPQHEDEEEPLTEEEEEVIEGEGDMPEATDVEPVEEEEEE